MYKLSSSDLRHIVEHNHEYNNSKEQILSIGSANTLQRAMTVNKLREMLDCINDMKYYAKTVEKDVPNYLETISIDKKIDVNTNEFEIDNIVQMTKESSTDNRYILLKDLIEQENIYVFYMNYKSLSITYVFRNQSTFKNNIQQ